MTDNDALRRQAKELAANVAAQAIRNTMQLLANLGVPLDAILAGAHAEIITQAAAICGGAEAAAMCKRASNRVRHLPAQVATDALETATSMGRA